MRNILLFVAFMCSIYLYGLNVNDLVKQMSEEDLVKTGFNKLSQEELDYFQFWLQYKSPYYYARMTIDESSKQSFFYKTEFCYGLFFPETPNDYVDESRCVWDLALCSSFQHDAKYLKEWIEYYKLLGVQHFYLYNNLSSDHYYDVLRPYIEKGELELFEYPVRDFIYGQNYCSQDAVMRARGRARWLIMADSDLFFIPRCHANLVSFLKDYENFGGVTVNYYNFGTNNVANLAPDELMTECLFKRCPTIERSVKSIVKPHRVNTVPSPHYATYKPGYFAVDENFNRIEGPFNDLLPSTKIQINHYMFRTKDFFYQVSLLRHARFFAVLNHESLPLEVPETLRQSYEEVDKKCSKINDFSIFRFLPFLKSRLSNEAQN